MNVNVTRPQETDADIDGKLRQMSRDMQRHFAESPVCSIQILKAKDDKEESVEGGINGHFFSLKKGVPIPDVPMPILDTLDEAGIQYSRLGPVRPSAAMLAKQQTVTATKGKGKGKDAKAEQPEGEEQQ